MKTHIVQQTKQQLRKNISKNSIFVNTRNWIGPLNGERSNPVFVVVDENNNKNWKVEKFLKMYIIITFKTFHYKLTALGNIVHSILNYKLMRPVSILRLPKE